MQRGLREKFKDPELREMLLDTGDEELVEGNFWHDLWWGDCGCKKCKDVPGKNILGKLLMELREKIKKENITNL